MAFTTKKNCSGEPLISVLCSPQLEKRKANWQEFRRPVGMGVDIRSHSEIDKEHCIFQQVDGLLNIVYVVVCEYMD